MSIFKIALPGSNVRDSKLNEEAIDSLYPSPKVSTLAQPPHAGIIFLNWSSTTIALGQNTTKLLYSFPHGYNYIPTAIGNYRFDNGSTIQTGTLPFQYGGLGLINLETTRTAVNLQYVSFDLALSPFTPIPPFLMRVRFYIMAERGIIS